MSVTNLSLRIRVALMSVAWIFMLFLSLIIISNSWSYFIENLGLFMGYVAVLSVGLGSLIAVMFSKYNARTYSFWSGQAVPKTHWQRFNAKMNRYYFEGRGLYSFWGMFVFMFLLLFSFSINGCDGLLLNLNQWFSWYGVSYNLVLPSSFSKDEILLNLLMSGIVAGALSVIFKYLILPHMRVLYMQICLHSNFAVGDVGK